jgi:hypothetical protein
VSIVEFREDACSTLEVITLVAGQAFSSTVGSSALVANWNAGFVGVEEPSLRAGKADLVVPIPGGTSGISGVSIV